MVAHRDGQGIVGSDLPAALPILRQRPGPVVYLEAGEMAQVTRQGMNVFDLKGNSLTKEMRTVFPQDALVDRGGYRHYMLKENNGTAPGGGWRPTGTGQLRRKPG